MSNLAAIAENKEAFALLLQSKRDLRHEMIFLFSNLHAVWKNLPTEMADDAKTLILRDIVEKGLLELSHSSSVLDDQINNLLRVHGESVRVQQKQLRDQDRIIESLREQSGCLQQKLDEICHKYEETDFAFQKQRRELNASIEALREERDRLQQNVSTKHRESVQNNATLRAIKHNVSKLAQNIEEDIEKNFFNKISTKDILNRLRQIIDS